MTVYNKVWDKCVLTAANESQAIVYRLQLQRLKRAGVLHPETEYLVIPDPNGVRIGSGGATLQRPQIFEKRRSRSERYKQPSSYTSFWRRQQTNSVSEPILGKIFASASASNELHL